MVANGLGTGRDAPVFVDRRDERRALEDHADEAWQGRLRIVAVVGEAGSGKTALVDSMMPRWQTDGARILAATCHEDLAVPYLPVITAIGGGIETGRAGTDAASPARPTASLVDRTPELFIALTDRLLATASAGPTVLRLDDLHWADPATLQLLGHLLDGAARRASREQLMLLVVLGFRPFAPRSPAANLSERLGRESAYRELRLGALDELSVNDLLHELLGRPPTRRLLADVVETTEGNPLHVRRLVEHLQRRGAPRIVGGEVAADGEMSAARAAVDQVLRTRLDELSESASLTLTVAAHLGDAQPVDDLRWTCQLEPDDFDDALDQLETWELLSTGTDGRYSFSHGTVRQFVYGDVPDRARRRRHRDLADRLLAAGGSDDARILQVAHHLRRAGDYASPELVFEFGGRAAKIAGRLGAWEKAARYAELALDADSATAAAVAVRLELHLDAALAHFRNHDATETAAHCREAVRLARAAGDVESWGRALLVAHRSLLTLSGRVEVDLDDHDPLREYLRDAGNAASGVRARGWQLLAEVATSAGAMPEAQEALEHALALAEQTDDEVLVAEVAFADGLAHFGAMEPTEAIASFETSAASARAGGDDWILAWPLGRMPLSHVMAGDLDAADDAADVAMELDSRTQHWAEQGLATAGSALVALARNDMIRCDRETDDAVQLFQRSSYPYTATVAWPVQAYARALRLDRLGALQVLDRWRLSGVGGAGRFGILVDALTLPVPEFRKAVDLDRYQPTARSTTHAFSAGGLAVDLELGVRVGAEDVLVAAVQRLDDLTARGVRLLLPIGASVERLRGMARIGLGDVREGARILAEAAADMRAIGARTEELRCEMERCIALVTEPDPDADGIASDVARRLDEASLIGPLQRLRELLPTTISTGVRLRRTVVCWDMIDSTVHLVAAGDEAFVDLVHEMNELIHRRLTEYRGVAFKYTGDGVIAWFLDSADALRCSAAVARDVRSRVVSAPLRLRTGVAVGQPIDDAGDLFGVAVVAAARLCSVAEADEVYCTAETVDAARPPVATRHIGPMTLKGLDAVDVVALDLS